MAKVGRDVRCWCGGGLRVKRCCGVARGPSRESLALGFLRSGAGEVAGSAGALSEREFARLLSLALGFLRSPAREVAGSAGALSEREFARLLAEYRQIATPFQWTFTPADLDALLARLAAPAPQLRLAAC